MPSGGRRVQLGDKCRDCDRVIIQSIAIYKGWLEYLQPRCKHCYYKHRDKVPSRSKERRSKTYLEWKWKIPQSEYDRKRELQLGGCAICKQPCSSGRRLSVDHDHKTGVIRDLLCFKCNAILGLVNDDDGRLSDVIDYIKRHNQKQSA